MAKTVKKEIKFNGLIIKLYYPSNESENSGEGIINIEAFDMHNRILWIAEKPTFDKFYWDMQLNEESNLLEADGGGGEKYEIDLSNGKIVKFFLVK